MGLRIRGRRQHGKSRADEQTGHQRRPSPGSLAGQQRVYDTLLRSSAAAGPKARANRLPWVHAPDEVIGANAIVFVREMFACQPWIDCARQMEVPYYYFLDDNFMLLRKEHAEFASYTDDAVRKRLQAFAGVLLSTGVWSTIFARRTCTRTSSTSRPSRGGRRGPKSGPPDPSATG